ncbi:RNA polymerase II-associated protein 3 [Mycena sanguinolenta]|uniref:RNA polymerase II-associated protein 3 n=1 Tax=Mycena sanguinolenta TaxID=230812 RepID=A0A8H6X9I2_9AGAR|nr:RNA polymerase II-associated protein 3 [Mycena sanguinolenta]
MASTVSHPELNAKAGESFRAGDFVGAAKYYELATQATGNTVPIYLSNLAAAYLKIGKYRAAEQAADKALRLEPRAIKPRYRRAIARKKRNLISEAMIDLASLLTTDPRNVEARAEFQTLTAIQNQRDKIQRALIPEEILKADSPSAHGSSTNPPLPTHPDLHLRGLPLFQRIQQTSPVNVGGIHGACHVCKKAMHRRDLKECQKCRRVTYCGVACQRAHWPDHKRACNVAP